MEYLQIVRMNLANLKCWLSFYSSFLSGGNLEEAKIDFILCISALDNPGTYLGGAGNMMDTFEVAGEAGGMMAKMGDCLYGAWDATH